MNWFLASMVAAAAIVASAVVGVNAGFSSEAKRSGISYAELQKRMRELQEIQAVNAANVGDKS